MIVSNGDDKVNEEKVGYQRPIDSSAEWGASRRRQCQEPFRLVRARNLLLMGLPYLAASLWGLMVCPVAGAFHTWEIGSHDLRGRYDERRVHIQRDQGFDVSGRAYDIDPMQRRSSPAAARMKPSAPAFTKRKGMTL